ncbi:COP9 signalosome complex subunit 1 [Hondaea fermentalgiana]|uniref:COP9 signalosome complex subunit 1 n=1 Tax=Hondaea fermentalgiana TaxID=2315210 RepID=A0A2R5G7U1_9STRA|nr:COP9 signalosome complex subunit 1 [Hondaea fermentalgiana]|eukprot:GBG27126.1 COP9 signalosome complex subunit 1 [Hondaea fermentalgiana]
MEAAAAATREGAGEGGGGGGGGGGGSSSSSSSSGVRDAGGPDLRDAINRYAGFTKVQRLHAALEAAKASGDAARLKQVVEVGMQCAREDDVPDAYLAFAGAGAGEGLSLATDKAWAEQRKHELELELQRLEQERNAARAEMVKEKIRMCLNAVGDLHYRLGLFNEALKSYTRARDYGSDSAHHLDTALRVIRSSLGAGNFANVPSWVNRATTILAGRQEVDKEAAAKLHAASGLVNMWQEDYQAAAVSFLNVGLELGNSFRDVITCEDVALYGGICALASFDRNELRSRVLSHSSFRTMLEAVPSVREMLSDFVGSRYTALSQGLAKLRVSAAEDLYLRKCWADLARSIQRRCLKQYILPFSSASLDLMATVFHNSRDKIERDVAKLIVDQEISATIDRESGFLDVTSENPREMAFRETLRVGKRFALDLEASILRSSLQKSGIIYAGPSMESSDDPAGMSASLGDDPSDRGGSGPNLSHDGGDVDTGESENESDVEMDDSGDRSAIATPS